MGNLLIYSATAALTREPRDDTKAKLGMHADGVHVVVQCISENAPRAQGLTASNRASARTDARLPQAPDLPSFAELGLPSVSYSPWFGLFAPRGTPKDIIGKLNAAAVEALADPAVRSRLAAAGVELFPRERQTPEALAAMVKADAEKWWPLIKELGIRAE